MVASTFSMISLKPPTNFCNVSSYSSHVICQLEPARTKNVPLSSVSYPCLSVRHGYMKSRSHIAHRYSCYFFGVNKQGHCSACTSVYCEVADIRCNFRCNFGSESLGNNLFVCTRTKGARRALPKLTESKKLRAWVSSTLAAVAVVSFSTSFPAMADLNKFEAEQRGEFGIGSAAQFGSADLKKTVHVNENFRRANFTSADMRESDFSGSTFNGAYLEKAVAYKANFTGADFSDTLMDRMVLNEANLTNAVLVRTVLTRSDLGGAIIEGADFSDAVIDLPQKQALCKYANGTNPITGVSTRASLGCGNKRRNAYGSPSSPLLSAPPPKMLDRDGFCDSASGLCEAN